MKTTPVPVVFLLVLASVPVPCDSSQPPVLDLEALPETRSLFAPLDDVHLLSSGLLQLGQSMREFVQKTKGQISTIFQKLNIFDRSFVRLKALAGEIKESEEELKQTAAVLNTYNEEIKELSEKISVKVESILQEKGQLLNKVEIMEEKLSSLSVDLVTVRQAAEINSLRVSDLCSGKVSDFMPYASEMLDGLNINPKVSIRFMKIIKGKLFIKQTLEFSFCI